MSPLVKIRSERDRMSAVERRIADFILDNAQLLRDYSSQQLANALGISQSSVVKFSQKLGYKGYPDLKYSVGEAVIRAEHGEDSPEPDDARAGQRAPSQFGELWRRKSEAEEATRLINPPQVLHAAAAAIGQAGRIFMVGIGDDDMYAHAFALKLSMLGLLVVHSVDLMRMAASVSAAGRGDVLLVFSEHGQLPALLQIARQFRDRRGHVITVTRHTANPLRALADSALLVSAHAEVSYLSPMLYQSSLQHLMDGLFILLCEGDEGRRTRWLANLERVQSTLNART